jgi:hypothetical protein
MWGRRGKRGTRLSRQLALARLEDAMSRAQDPDDQPSQALAVPAVPAPRPGGLVPERPARLGRRPSA